MSLKNQGRRFTENAKMLLHKKVAGDGGSIYILVMMFILFFLLLYKAGMDKERLYVTYDSVDDSLVSSLIAASAVNIHEYGISGQLVIYRDLTENEEITYPGSALTEEQIARKEEREAQELLTSTKLFSPTTDAYLNKAYNTFLGSLKTNLKLDDSMNASISGINGTVTINEFAVYNMYEYYGSNGNRLHYRFFKYTYNGGTWSVCPYEMDTPVEVYNSFDHSNTVLDSTTVCASLSFDVQLSDYSSWLYQGKSPDDMVKGVTYQRLVDVTD